MEAAVHSDVTLLKQAMLHDPLVGAVCNPEEVWQMTDEMLVAQAQWLPQYAGDIAAAAERLDAHVAKGTRVELRETEGAARLHTKTVEEMSAEAEASRRNAAAADKGRRSAHRNHGAGCHIHGRLVHDCVPHPHLSGHDRALRLFAAREEPVIHQEHVQPSFLWFFSHFRRSLLFP